MNPGGSRGWWREKLDEEAMGRRKESMTRAASMAPLDARFSADCGVIWEAGKKDKCVFLGTVIGSPCKAMHPSSFVGSNKEHFGKLSFLVFLRIMWKFFLLCGDGIQAIETQFLPFRALLDKGTP